MRGLDLWRSTVIVLGIWGRSGRQSIVEGWRRKRFEVCSGTKGLAGGRVIWQSEINRIVWWRSRECRIPDFRGEGWHLGEVASTYRTISAVRVGGLER
jgi:hypothetical protein